MSDWSTQQLTAFLAVVSTAPDQRTASRVAIELMRCDVAHRAPRRAAYAMTSDSAATTERVVITMSR